MRLACFKVCKWNIRFWGLIWFILGRETRLMIEKVVVIGIPFIFTYYTKFYYCKYEHMMIIYKQKSIQRHWSVPLSKWNKLIPKLRGAQVWRCIVVFGFEFFKLKYRCSRLKRLETGNLCLKMQTHCHVQNKCTLTWCLTSIFDSAYITSSYKLHSTNPLKVWSSIKFRW